MTADVAILTAIYDSYETLKPVFPQDGLTVDWVAVTDDPAIAAGVPGWRVVHKPEPGTVPMRAAKAAKFRPWDFTTAPASIWVDGSCRITSPTLAADFLAKADPVAGFSHWGRDCLYDEAEISARMFRYDGEPVAAQAAHYRALGFPEHWGLWETTVLGRRHTPQVAELGEVWAAQMDAWSSQDQVGFPFALHQVGLRPAWMPGGKAGSPWHAYEGSDRHDDRISV